MTAEEGPLGIAYLALEDGGSTSRKHLALAARQIASESPHHQQQPSAAP